MAALVRLDSKPLSIQNAVKAATARFDVEIIFTLSLRSKSLPSIPAGLECCINLVDLDLSNNQITRIEALENLPNLTRLDLSNNHIPRLEGLSHLNKLKHLKLQDNKLNCLRDLNVREQLQSLTSLQILTLQDIYHSEASGNGCCQEPGYKAAIISALPSLTNLDNERNPRVLNYAELVVEMKQAQVRPSPSEEIIVPNVNPWLDKSQTEAAFDAGQAQLDKLTTETATASTALVKSLDKCHMLIEVLNNEVASARQALEQGCLRC